MLTPLLFVDLVTGPVIILFGWVIARLFRTPGAQPAVPSAS